MSLLRRAAPFLTPFTASIAGTSLTLTIGYYYLKPTPETIIDSLLPKVLKSKEIQDVMRQVNKAWEKGEGMEGVFGVVKEVT